MWPAGQWASPALISCMSSDCSAQYGRTYGYGRRTARLPGRGCIGYGETCIWATTDACMLLLLEAHAVIPMLPKQALQCTETEQTQVS